MHELQISNNTHRDWHLCSGSNFDWLEVLLLCTDIRWLGYGFPVVKNQEENVIKLTTGKGCRRALGGKNTADRKKTFPAYLIHCINIQSTCVTWSHVIVKATGIPCQNYHNSVYPDLLASFVQIVVVIHSEMLCYERLCWTLGLQREENLRW